MPDRHRDPDDLAVVQLALAGVDAGSNLHPDLAHRVADGDGRPNGSCRPIERGEEPVAGGVQLGPLVASART